MGKSAKPPGPETPKHDRSMWRGLVVSADEFAPPRPRSRVRLWVLLGAIVVAAAGGIVFVFARSGSSARVADAAAPPDAISKAAQPVPAPPDAPPDTAAPIDATTLDAAPPEDAAPDTSVPPDAAPAVAPPKHAPTTKRKHKATHRK